ncbi:hypothetical protein K0M31_020212, partial [Melipona bicolor]
MEALTELFRESRVLLDTGKVFTARFDQYCRPRRDDDVSESVERPAINYNGVLGAEALEASGAPSIAYINACLLCWETIRP